MEDRSQMEQKSTAASVRDCYGGIYVSVYLCM